MKKRSRSSLAVLGGMVLFLFFFIFYSRIVPIVPFDSDDWYYMGYYRIPLPIWGDWNPSRVLPEILMPNLSILAARVLYPLLGNYIGAMTTIYAFFMAVLLVILCVELYRFMTSRRASSGVSALLTLLWALLHFTLLAGSDTGNSWLWGSVTATCYFYYAVPALWNEALVLYLMRTKGQKRPLFAKILLCILCYFGVFSNLFPAVILPAYAGMDFLCDFFGWMKSSKEGRKSFGQWLRSELFNAYVIILFLVSAIFELSGGRASGFSGFQFEAVLETLSGAFATVHPLGVLSVVVILVYSVISLNRKKRQAWEKDGRNMFLLELGAFLIVLLFNVLLCARTGAWYIGREDVLVDIVFFALLAVFTLASYACTGTENRKVPYVILGVVLVLNLLVFGKFSQNFYKPTNSGGLSAETCVEIDEDIVKQVTKAVAENQSRMDLRVPDFGSSDNWPLATYAGGPYSRFAYTLWRHGLLQKSININVVPDEAKNAEFEIG